MNDTELRKKLYPIVVEVMRDAILHDKEIIMLLTGYFQKMLDTAMDEWWMRDDRSSAPSEAANS